MFEIRGVLDPRGYKLVDVRDSNDERDLLGHQSLT